MGDNEYKISLGVDLNEAELNSIKKILQSIEDQKRDVVYNVDFNIKNLDKLTKVSSEIEKIKDQINNIGSSKKVDAAIPIDSKQIETSLNKIHDSIKKLQNAFGKVDKNKGVQSLLTTVNKIGKSLESVSKQFEGLNKNLSNFAGKEFSINLDFGLGKSGSKSSEQIVQEFNMLRKEAEEYEKYFGKIYSSAKSGTDTNRNAIFNLVSKYDRKNLSYLLGLSNTVHTGDGASQKRNAALKEYIRLIKEAAAIGKISLEPVEFRLAESSDFVKTKKEVSETEKKIKELFGGGNLNIEGLSAELKPIVEDLKLIREAIQSLSSIGTIDGLTDSFKELSQVLDRLTSNITIVKQSLDSVNETGNAVGQGGSGVENLEQDLKQVTDTAKNTADAIKETVGEAKKLDDISIDISNGNVDDLKNALKNLKVDDTSIENATKELNEMNIVATKVSGTLKNGKLAKWEIKGVQTTADGLERVVTITKTLGKEGWSNSTKYAQAFDKIADAAQRIQNKLKDTGFNGFDAEVDRMKTAVESLDASYNELDASLKRLDIAMEAMNSADQAGDIKRLVAANEEYEISLSQVISLLKKYQQAEKDAFNVERLKQAKASLNSDMEIWLKENTRATREFGEEVRRLQASLDGLDANGLKIAKQQFDNIKKTTKALGKDGLTVFDRLKSKAKEYMTYLSAAEMFMYAEQALRSMFEQVKLIDSAMTELKKVTNETDASYDQFLSNAASRAKEIGTTIDGLVSSTADFARLGYGFKDAQELAEVANIYAVVGDEIDSVETATESLISTMTAFGVKASDSMSIVDKFNEVGNNFAISSGGIGEALERSASSMAAANNSLDETIALITAANTVVQDADSVGTAFKTISMRIRGATTDLEEAGLDTEGMASSTAKLREEIMALSGVDIMLDSTTFKSTYKIMEELAAKWEHLTDIQQASITELIAGKRQGNIVSSLMTNFDIAQDALATSLDSSGSAMEEHEKYMDSIEAKLSQLKAAWQSFAQTFMSSDLLKGGIDALKTFVDILEVLVDNFGLLGTIGLSTVGTGAFKYFKSLKDIGADVVETVTNVVDAVDDIGDAVDDVADIIDPLADCTDIFDEAGKSIPNMIDAVDDASDAMGNLGGVTTKTGGSLKAFMKTPIGVASAIGVAIAAIGLIINAIKNYKEEQSKLRQETIKTSDEFLDAASSFEQAYIKYSGRTDLTSDEEAELQAAINGTVTALDDKSSALQNVVDNSNDYLASLEAIKNAELKAAEDAATSKRINAELELKNLVKGLTGLDGSEVNIDFGTGNASAMQQKAIGIARGMNSDFFEETPTNKDKRFSFELSVNADTNEILEYYYTLIDYKDKLDKAAEDNPELLNTSAYKRVSSAIGDMSEAVSVYETGIYEAVKAEYQLANNIPKTADEYVKMRESILNSDDIKKLSFDTKKIIADSLDSEYKLSFDLSDAEVQARKFVGIINGYNDGIEDGINEIGTVETFLNMRTAVNSDECSVGDYLSQFNEINALTKDWSDKEKEEFNLAFGLNTDVIKEQYDNVYNYLSRNYLNKLDTTGMDSNEIQSFMAVNSSAIRQFLNELSASELSALVGIKAEIDWENTSAEDILKQIQKEVDLQEALNFSADIKIDTTALEVLNTALSESASAIGLSSESIDGLQSRYAKLDNYDPSALFERTANGIKINREELEKLEKEYNDLTKTEVEEHLNNLVDEYNNLTSEIDKCTNAGERAQLISEREGYAKKIEELATYQAQLEGVTGAYQDWIDAQSASEDYEGYESVATSREGIKEEIDRGFIGNKSKKYIDLLSGADLTGANIDDYAAAWDNLSKKVTETGYSVNDFFTINDDGDITATGIDRFFTSLQTEFKGKVYRWNNETQSWYYDFSQENLKAIQDQWGIGIEAIELLLEAAASAGYDIDWGGILDGIDLDTSDFETLVSIAESAQAAFNELEGVDDVSFNFTATGVKEATSELEKARTTYIDLITNNDGSINLEANGAAEMRVMLSTLLIQKQQLEDSTISINIDTSGLDESQQDIADAIEAVKNFREKYKNLEIAVTTGQGIEEAKTELNTAMGELRGLGDAGIDIATKLIFGENSDANGATLKSQLDRAIQAAGSPDIEIGCKLSETAIGALNSQILTNFTPEATVKITEIDDTLVGEYTSTEKTAKGVVTWENYDELVIQFQEETHLATGIVNWDDNETNLKKFFSANGTVKWTSGNKVKVDVISEATGTANAGGTTGRAFVRGNWGIKGSGTALGGELGQELVVRDGKFFTIGDKGAEFFHYKPNDIIFNAAQTESLFKYGGIKGAKPRGTMLASGSAFAGGSRPSSGRAFPWSAEASESDFANKRNNGSLNIKADSVNISGDTGRNNSTGRTYNSSKANKDSKDEKEEFEETFDWVEIAISRIERAIDQLDQKANNVYSSWSSRNNALTKEISEVGDEISLQQKAYNEYMAAVNGVGLDESWAKKVRDGKIDIETIKDEALAEKIKDYQNWYLIMPTYLVMNM